MGVDEGRDGIDDVPLGLRRVAEEVAVLAGWRVRCTQVHRYPIHFDVRGVDAEAVCDVRAATCIVRRLGDRIGCVHEPVAVRDLLVRVTTVARFDGVDGVPADGVNSDVAREVWRVEALPGESLEWERERVRGSRIRYSYRLTDFVTNCVKIVLKLRHKYNELHGEQNKNDSTPSPICIFNLVDCYRDILYRAVRRT